MSISYAQLKKQLLEWVMPMDISALYIIDNGYTGNLKQVNT